MMQLPQPTVFCFVLVAAVFIISVAIVVGEAVAEAQHGAQQQPSYYWSRSRGNQFSSRPSHIGPLPHLNHVMTEWAKWGPWERCTRSCGGGVRSRSRTCATVYPRVMPGSGIRTSHDHCTGDSVQYGVCGTEPCPPGQVSGLSFRAAQCRHYNNRRVFGRVVNNWVPYTQSGINPCALVCEGEGEGIVYTFGKVTDGTHCRTDDAKDGLCVNGRCLRLSCDGRLGGLALEDMCRVCGGNNETCTRHVGIFHSDLPSNDQPDSNQRARQATMYGYYEVADIPQGATNVLVKDKSPNFLALKADSKFLLNGNWLIDWPGDVDAAGTPFSYVRTEDNSETLMALGPTKEDLTLLVLLREHNPGIYYEYWTPNMNGSSTQLTITPSTTTSSSTTTTTTTTSTTTTTTARPAIIKSVNITRSRQPYQGRVHHKLVLPKNEKSHHDVFKSTKHPHHLPRLDMWYLNYGERQSENAYGEKQNTNILQKNSWDDKTNKFKSDQVSKETVKTHYNLHNSNTLSTDPTSKSSFSSTISYPRRPFENEILKPKITEKPKKKKNKKKKDPKPVKGTDHKGSISGKSKGQKKSASKLPTMCGDCVKARRAKEKFCTSDFVSRVEVLGSDEVIGERRYEVLVHQSYKNTVPLLHKEFLWLDNICNCPRLRTGRSYIVMGRTAITRGREVRFVLGSGSYVKRYNPRNLARILRIRHNELKYCRPWRRDLRFQRNSDITQLSPVERIASNQTSTPLLNT